MTEFYVASADVDALKAVEIVGPNQSGLCIIY